MGQGSTQIILQSKFQFIPKQALRPLKKVNSYSWTNIWGHQIADNLIEHGHKIKQWHVSNLSIGYARRFQILKTIGDIQFPHLKIIAFYDLTIYTVESLSRMNAPNLKQLSLNNNLITNIASLRKMQSSQLKYLQLNDNKIIEGKSLPEANWDIAFFWLQSSLYQCHSIAFCIKMKISNQMCYRLRVRSALRISEKGLKENLIRKYPNNVSANVYIQSSK